MTADPEAVTRVLASYGIDPEDAADIAADLASLPDDRLAEAWDQGRAAERRDWEFTFDLSTPDEDRQPLPNPYRAALSGGDAS